MGSYAPSAVLSSSAMTVPSAGMSCGSARGVRSSSLSLMSTLMHLLRGVECGVRGDGGVFGEGGCGDALGLSSTRGLNTTRRFLAGGSRGLSVVVRGRFFGRAPGRVVVGW